MKKKEENKKKKDVTDKNCYDNTELIALVELMRKPALISAYADTIVCYHLCFW